MLLCDIRGAGVNPRATALDRAAFYTPTRPSLSVAQSPARGD